MPGLSCRLRTVPLFRRPFLCWLPVVMLPALLACSPTFNWRQVRTEPAPLAPLMPCKPERAERRVPMTESGVGLQLMRCEAGGLTFAVSWAKLAPGDNREAVFQRWHQASLPSWQAAETELQPPPAGARDSLRHVWQGTGRNHRGEPLALRATYVAAGDWVYQGLIAGAPPSDDVVSTFMDSLQ